MSTRGRPRALRPWIGGLTCLAAIAGLVACSNGDDGELDLGDATTLAPTSSPTTASPPTTTAPTTTAPATTTTEPAAATTTTEPLDVEAQIRADFARIIDLRVQCGQEPETCPIAEITAPGSEYEEFLTTLMERRTEANLRSRPGAGSFEFKIEKVEVSAEGKAAVVTACQLDSIVLFDVGPDGSADPPIIFDDSVVSSRTQWKLSYVNDRWLVDSAEALAETVGVLLCDV